MDFLPYSTTDSTTTPDGDVIPAVTLLDEDTGDYTAYRIYETKIKGLLLFERKYYADERGGFQEKFRVEPIEKFWGREINIKQSALSFNKPGVLRGIHAEQMDKLITLVKGEIFIAIVDLRTDSETFGEYVSFTINQTREGKMWRTICLPSGMGNSFLVLGDQDLLYDYSVSGVYTTSEGKRAIVWNDPDINISWPEEPRIMSEADRKNQKLRDVFPDKIS